MDTIKLKVTEFDEVSQSLIISFAPDNEDPENYTSCAYQPYLMFPETKDLNEILKKIAYTGIHTVEMQKAQETIKNDTQKINDLKGLVGKTLEFQVSEISTIFSIPDGEVSVENLEDPFKQKVLFILAEQGLL